MTAPITDPVEPPNAIYTRQRYIRLDVVEWVEKCDRILMDHGLVRGQMVYEKRKTARNRAERLIRYMVELRMHERWQLTEHTDRKDGGYVWAVEYRGGKDNHARPERIPERN